MPNPFDTSNDFYTVTKVYYDKDDFSVAELTCTTGEKPICIRWNNSRDGIGFPKDRNGNPAWLILPTNMREDFLEMIEKYKR